MELQEIIDLYESEDETKIKDYEAYIGNLKRDLANDETYRNYQTVMTNLKNKILSVIVPTNVDDNDPKEFVIKVCSNMEDPGCAIPYLPSQKQAWKDILHSLGDYMNLDFSDILKPDWNFRKTYGADGELTPDSDGYLEGVSQKGIMGNENEEALIKGNE